jgi:hypothetical protein
MQLPLWSRVGSKCEQRSETIAAALHDPRTRSVQDSRSGVGKEALCSSEADNDETQVQRKWVLPRADLLAQTRLSRLNALGWRLLQILSRCLYNRFLVLQTTADCGVGSVS